MARFLPGQKPGDDYPEKIKKLRASLGFTQQTLAGKLGVSFATVNRWENGQTKPSQLSWTQILQLLISVEEETSPQPPKSAAQIPPVIDFTASPEIVKVLAEGERLSFGHLANPTFATEISRIDPLPHQRIAVYDYLKEGKGAGVEGGADKVLIANADLEPSEVQEMGDVMPDLLKIKARGNAPIRFRVRIELGDGKTLPPQETADEINKILKKVKEEFQLQ